MARNSAAKLTLTGDSKSLEKAFDRAGQSAKDMAKDFDKAGSDAKSMGSKVEGVGTAVGDQESKFMGVADVLDGLATAFGFNVGPMVDYARAAGDITGGIENLKGTVGGIFDTLGKWTGSLFGASTAAGTATTAVAGQTVATGANTVAVEANTVATKGQTLAAKAAAIAQGALNFVMNQSPAVKIALIVAALGAAIIVAYKESETFRRIVKGAFEAIKKPAEAAMAVINGVLEAIKGVLRFLGILDDKTAATKADTVAAFKDIQAQARASAAATGTAVPEGTFGRGLVSGHAGLGRVPGPMGAPTAIMALGGERILSPGQSGGGGDTYHIHVGAGNDGTAVVKAIQDYVRRNGPLVGVAA